MDRYLDIFHSFHKDLMDPDRLPVAVLAVVLCAVIGMVTGPMHGNANPFIWKGVNALFGRLGQRLDRPGRARADLAGRGIGLTLAALVLGYGVGQAAAGLVLRWPLWGVTQILLLALALTAGTVWFSLLRVYTALEKGGKVSPGSYVNIARTTRTDMTNMDDFGITRLTMAMTVRCFDKGMVAPLFWFLVLGLPGAYIYAVLAAMAWRFGKDGQSRGFGAGILALEKLMGWVPMTLSASFVAAAGLFTPTGGMTRAFKALFSKKGAIYAEGGPPVTALAHALDVSLGGPATDLEGSVIKRGWIGPSGATAKLEAGHLRRALYMGLMAHLLLIASLLGAMLWAG